MMKYIRSGLFALCIWMLSGLTWANPDIVSFAQNLHNDAQLAQHKGVPVLIIFTSPGCSYCERVMKNYLIPMQRNADYAKKVLIRRVDIASDTPLIDFNGKTTTGRQYALSLKAKFTPTIIVFTPDGVPAGDPLVGLGPEDYYGGYLDAAIDAGLEKMHPAAH
jgi:thioredoxin-related protein